MNNNDWQLTNSQMRDEAMTNADYQAEQAKAKQDQPFDDDYSESEEKRTEESAAEEKQHWTESAAERARVLSELRTMAYMQGKTTDLDQDVMIQHDHQFMSLYEAWGKDSRDFAKPNDMVFAWDQYLVDARAAVRYADDVETIEASLSFEVGAVRVGFSIKRDFFIGSERERLAVTEHLQQKLMEQHENYMRKNQDKLPGKKSRSKGKHAQNSGAVEVMSDEAPANGEYAFKVKKLVVDKVNDELQYKVFGGGFTKWGVSIYPDSGSLEGFTFQEFGVGTHMPPAIAVVHMRNGNPKRVLRLVRETP